MTVRSVTEQSSSGEVAAAQALFGRYAEFLRAISACHGFNFERFAEEIAALPTPYSEQGGELLLAVQHEEEASAAQGVAVGCVAYRTAPAALLAAGEEFSLEVGGAGAARVCEIKRLFLAPEARGQRIGQMLVREAMDRATRRGYRRAVLDTEPTSMAAAYRIYTGLGFTEFRPVSAGSGGPKVIYLERVLG